MKLNKCNLLVVFFLSLYGHSQTSEIDTLHQRAIRSSGAKQVIYYTDAANAAYQADADTALFFARKAIELANDQDYDFGKMMAYRALGRIFGIKGEYSLSTKYFTQVCELATTLKNDTMLATGYTGVGSNLWQTGQHAKALENHFKALRLRESINDVKGIASSKVNIGMIYQSQNKPALAEQYVSDALKLLEEVEHSSLKLTTLHTMANIMGMQGKISEALRIDTMGIELAESTNNEFAKAMFYDNIANCFLYGNPPNYHKAIEYFYKTLEIDSSFSNRKQMSDTYHNLGNAFMMQKKFMESIGYFQRSVLLARQSGFAQGQLKSYESLANAFKLSGQPDKAFEALREHNRIKDSLFNSASEAKMVEMQTLYDTVKKEQKIEQQDNRIRFQNFLFIGIAGLVLLAALLGQSLYKRHNLKKESQLQAEIMNQQQLATRAVLEAEENERQRIARDLHDGLGQMMSAAKMNLSAFESELKFSGPEQKRSFENVIKLVDDSCREVRTVSHIMMPNVLLKNGLAAALRDFVDKLDERSLKVHLFTEGLGERLDSNTEIVLYRVIQECVNNVIKHSGAATLDISVTRDNQGINATIEDDGKGFDTTNMDRFEGIGLKNILSRVDFLKGTIDFDSAPGRGTVIALHIPQ